MVENESERKVPRASQGIRRRIQLLMVLLLCFMGWAGITLWGQEAKLNNIYSQLHEMEDKKAEVVWMNEQYKLDTALLNDDEFIEQRVRKDYHMARPGDTIFKSVKPNP